MRVSSGDTAADRERLGELFERILEQKPDDRDAYIEAVCGGDRDLRSELISLLASHAAAPEFLERLEKRILTDVLRTLSDDIPPGERVAGRYEILERLGDGGMGVVYKALDAALDRLVALKFLPPYRSTDPVARARLKREARAASALDHPNIAIVHDIGATAPAPGDPEGGALFIAMAYYVGETLKKRIGRGPLDLHQAIHYAVQLADALAAAHQAGIVHRDIKPANVLLTEGDLVKVVDFGLAIVAGAKPGHQSDTAGTVAYMSPEQTYGKPVDHRTDIWSLGVVLYEMLSGRRPFRGNADAVLHGIRSLEPEPVTSIREDVPSSLVRVVERCLTKDPYGRYGTASELLADLRGVAGSAADPPKPSIVVLPFANIGGRQEDEYFSDGLTDEMIGDLSRIRALRVISRTSAMRLKGSDKDVGAISRELGVRYVLEGGVRRTGEALRITVRLIDAHREEQLWARKVDCTVGDVFEAQEQIARAVLDVLQVRLSPSEARLLGDRPISDVRAYEAYLQARFEIWTFAADGLARAERHIESALAIVGDNELLYGALGHIWAIRLEGGIDPRPATIGRVEEFAAKVFALNPDSARGHFLTMWAAFHRGDMRRAIDSGERARALEPNNADTLLLLGYILAHVGRNAEARALLRHALEIDPLTPLTQGVQGFVAIMEGRFEEAIEPYRRCYRMDPHSPFAAGCLGWALAYDRRIAEATAALDAAATRFPDTTFGAYAGSLAHGLQGNSVAALDAITPELEAAARNSEMFARFLAGSYSLAGENRRALDCLERAVDLGMLNYEFLARHDWFLDGVRGEPRFHALLERVRRASAQLA